MSECLVVVRVREKGNMRKRGGGEKEGEREGGREGRERERERERSNWLVPYSSQQSSGLVSKSLVFFFDQTKNHQL